MNERSNFSGQIAYDDLRQWFAQAERLGDFPSILQGIQKNNSDESA